MIAVMTTVAVTQHAKRIQSARRSLVELRPFNVRWGKELNFGVALSGGLIQTQTPPLRYLYPSVNKRGHTYFMWVRPNIASLARRPQVKQVSIDGAHLAFVAQ